MAHATKRLLLLLATITLAGCATTSALRSGENAEAAQDYDRAIVEYTRALQANPDLAAARRQVDPLRTKPAQARLLPPPMLEATIWQWPTDPMHPWPLLATIRYGSTVASWNELAARPS